MSTAPIISKGAAAKPGKYLTFILGHESYGVPVLKVREIIRLCAITVVPNMAQHIKGVINLRGKIIPVVDLRLTFRLAAIQDNDRTCIVVVEVHLASGVAALMGLIVDGVEEVVNIPQNEIEPTPDFGTTIDTEYILGMAKIKGTVKTLLDIDCVLAAETLHQVGRIAAGSARAMNAQPMP